MLTSCSSKLGGNVTDLFGKQWMLNSMMGNSDLASMFGDKIPFFTINDSGRITGKDGCNNLTGNLDLKALKKGQLDLGNLVSTKMACMNDGPAKFMDAMGDVSNLKFGENGGLNLMDAAGNTIMDFISK